MVVSWLTLVRCLYVAIFTLALIPFFLFLHLYSNQVRFIEDGDMENDLADDEAGEYDNKDNDSNQESILTRGVAAKVLYETGHVNVNFQICSDLGKNVKLLIVVTSAPSHEIQRLAVRETWGHFTIRKEIAIAFMLGATSIKTFNDKVDREQELHSDIIRGKFVDTYDNLTLKTISMLEWVYNYCPKASFVLKTDDDTLINVSKLLAFIAIHKPDQRVIYGRLAVKWTPIINKESKYYISPHQYKPSIFTKFIRGSAYLFPAQISRELYETALNYTYFKLEDVFLTGIVAKALKIKLVHVPEFLSNLKKWFNSCNFQNMISIPHITSADQYNLWYKLHDVVKCEN